MSSPGFKKHNAQCLYLLLLFLLLLLGFLFPFLCLFSLLVPRTCSTLNISNDDGHKKKRQRDRNIQTQAQTRKLGEDKSHSWEVNSEGKILESRNRKVQKCRKCKKLNPIIELFKNPKVQKCRKCEIVRSNILCAYWIQ